jgi:hypothetical protein
MLFAFKKVCNKDQPSFASRSKSQMATGCFYYAFSTTPCSVAVASRRAIPV